jgi:hypothetical protein
MDSDLPTLSPPEQKRTSFCSWRTFKHPIARFVMTMFIDIILPLGIFFGLQKTIKPVYALILAGAPPFVMVIIKVILTRTFDALGFISCIGFVASAIVGIATKDPITVLLGNALVTGVISSIFTISLIPFYRCHRRLQIRPLVYYFYQDLAPIKREQLGLPESIFINKQETINEQYSKDENEVLIPKVSDKQEVSKVYEWMFTTFPSFSRSCYLVTAIWSVGLFFGFLGQLILILIHLPINTIFTYNQVILVSIIVLCIILSINFIRRGRKKTMIHIEEWKREHLTVQ